MANKKMIETKWVTKLIPTKAWNETYSSVGSYCFLADEGISVRVGFLAANVIPPGCELATTNEMARIDTYRKNFNVFPVPYPETH